MRVEGTCFTVHFDQSRGNESTALRVLAPVLGDGQMSRIPIGFMRRGLIGSRAMQAVWFSSTGLVPMQPVTGVVVKSNFCGYLVAICG